MFIYIFFDNFYPFLDDELLIENIQSIKILVCDVYVLSQSQKQSQQSQKQYRKKQYVYDIGKQKQLETWNKSREYLADSISIIYRLCVDCINGPISLLLHPSITTTKFSMLFQCGQIGIILCPQAWFVIGFGQYDQTLAVS